VPIAALRECLGLSDTASGQAALPSYALKCVHIATGASVTPAASAEADEGAEEDRAGEEATQMEDEEAEAEAPTQRARRGGSLASLGASTQRKASVGGRSQATTQPVPGTQDEDDQDTEEEEEEDDDEEYGRRRRSAGGRKSRS
jgi:hypothetical protein